MTVQFDTASVKQAMTAGGDVRAAKRLKYGAEKLGQERGWEERQNQRMLLRFHQEVRKALERSCNVTKSGQKSYMGTFYDFTEGSHTMATRFRNLSARLPRRSAILCVEGRVGNIAIGFSAERFG